MSSERDYNHSVNGTHHLYNSDDQFSFNPQTNTHHSVNGINRSVTTGWMNSPHNGDSNFGKRSLLPNSRTYPLSSHNITITKIPSRASQEYYTEQSDWAGRDDDMEDYARGGGGVSTLPAYLRSKFNGKRVLDNQPADRNALFRSEISTFQVGGSNIGSETFTNTSLLHDSKPTGRANYNQTSYNSLPREFTTSTLRSYRDDGASPSSFNNYLNGESERNHFIRNNSLEDRRSNVSADRMNNSLMSRRTDRGTPIHVQHINTSKQDEKSGKGSMLLSSNNITSHTNLQLNQTSMYTPHFSGASGQNSSKLRAGQTYSPFSAILNGGSDAGGEEEVEELMNELMTNMGISGNQTSNRSSGTCAKCNKMIESAEAACTVLQQTFHISCFICTHCSCLLHGGSFYVFDGRPLCEMCYQGTLERCTLCHEPITERLLRAAGRRYHPQCFTCVACDQCLDGQMFTTDVQSNLYCIDHFHRRYATVCAVCCEPIVPQLGQDEAMRIVALDQNFHIECYKCQECGTELSCEVEGMRECYLNNGRLLCRRCNNY